MIDLSEYSSLTWDSAAWIYSVIIGVVLARYFMFIANLLQEPKAIKFYYPYLAFMLVSIINLYVSWYTGKQTYTEFEGKTLIFAIRSFSDAISSIAALIIVPQDKLLEDFFDMKSWFMKIKKVYFLPWHCFFAFEIQCVLLYPETITTEQLIGISVFAVIMALINVVSALSKNDYYLSFHGTLMIVFLSYNLSQL